MQELKQLEKYLTKSQNILITTHLSNDIDGIGGSLLLKLFLDRYYPNVKSQIILEDNLGTSYADLKLPGIEKVTHRRAVNARDYDLIIVVDVYSLERCFRGDLSEFDGIPVVVMDHHQLPPEISADVLIHNSNSTSATEVVYETFKKLLGKKLEVDEKVAYLVQAGILFDTNRFLWNPSPKMFKTMHEMYTIYPIKIEPFFNLIVKYTRKSIFVFNYILKNSQFKDDLVYSYIEDEIIEDEVPDVDRKDITSASLLFLDHISRQIEGVNWGFLVKGSSTQGMWRVMFRSIMDTVDVSKYCEALGGGGHTNAGSGVVNAETAKEAAEKVLELIEKVDKS